METKRWKEIKDSVYGKKGTERRDELDRDFESFKIGLLLRKAREGNNFVRRTEFDSPNVDNEVLIDAPKVRIIEAAIAPMMTGTIGINLRTKTQIKQYDGEL
ncbi:hypothetical protein [Flavobacterium sp. 316]|uniref:hypothetical protein n=1 Tax=Flavobacterium sp. 316 TaxID=1603293 RepID=UPI000AE698A8|nr:hypothetical protein [Flavobacterium sp. 316]